jgi:hypothetical protein
MDALKSILIFCNDDEHPGVAVTTSLQIEHYDHAPMMITRNRELYGATRLQLSGSGDWNLNCLDKTRSLWLEFVVAMRGDILYTDETITLILAHAGDPTSCFYFYNGRLVAFTTRASYLKRVIDILKGDELFDVNNWKRFVGFFEALIERVSRVEISKLGGIND